MENHKIYLTDGQTLDIVCDYYEFNQNTASYDFYFKDKIGFSIRPHFVSIREIRKESKLAMGKLIPR